MPLRAFVVLLGGVRRADGGLDHAARFGQPLLLVGRSSEECSARLAPRSGYRRPCLPTSCSR